MTHANIWRDMMHVKSLMYVYQSCVYIRKKTEEYQSFIYIYICTYIYIYIYIHAHRWTYEYCYQKHLKQFHQENNVNTAEFFLGMYNAGAAGPEAILSDDGGKESTAFYVQRYGGGTECDVTGEVIWMYMCMYMYVYVYITSYIWREREFNEMSQER